MPIGNNFEHAPYSRSDPGDRVKFLEVQPSAPPDSPAWQDAMAQYGKHLSDAGVKVIVFLSGVNIGTDLFGMERLDDVGGLKRGYSRGIPGMEALLALMRQETNGIGTLEGEFQPPFTDDRDTKTWVDNLLQDAGNFSQGYVELYAKGLNRDLSKPIHCIRLLWSAAHHHLGRAEAACHVVHTLGNMTTQHHLERDDRILIHAHGHAGQVLALASNLIASVESEGRRSLLQILRAYYETTNSLPGFFETYPTCESFESSLQNGMLFNGASLDFVTYGTPVRYGWDTAGVRNLLHIVNHRMMRTDGKKWLGKMELPQVTMEMPIAWGGDYVQQLAVAGCDALPKTPEAQVTNKGLWELLEPWDGFERWLECSRKAVRCPKDGQCLLVDYKDSTGSTNGKDHFYGHAAYTRHNHMLFNTASLVESLYSS